MSYSTTSLHNVVKIEIENEKSLPNVDRLARTITIVLEDGSEHEICLFSKQEVEPEWRG